MKYKEVEKISYIKQITDKIKFPRILELGVQKGNSTKMFLELCDKNDGYLISVDIDDCSLVASNKRWKFIHSSDDNFNLINNKINEKLDLIFIDSYHEPNHIKKIFYNYYKFLKTDGICIIDDISWLPYSKFNICDNDFIERINRLTFEKILNIYNSNTENFILDFHFEGTGLAIIKKIKDELCAEKKIKNRLYNIKNLLKKIYSPKPIK
jgi:predicted O-methyltransferase YrrM